MVVAGVAVNDVKVLNLVELMLCSVSSVCLRYSRVESTTKNSGQPSLLELVLVSPLP